MRIKDCVAFASLLASLSMSAQRPFSATMPTDRGNVEGSLTPDGKVLAFKGIPFAAPPVGDLRWRPPQPVTPWKGVRAAQEFGAHCWQSSTYNDMVFHDAGASEDCLTLNVWAPAGAKRGALPVMVWVYGGGFTTGGTSEDRQDGQFLAHRDVVVVSMNYRLGIFGFLALPELAAESAHHASGNYGLMDQAAALEWVKRNIAAFGGDPANVTIFGESAGSFSVSALMASPLSKGLISKAIGESGGAFSATGLRFEGHEVVEDRDQKFAAEMLHAPTLAQIRKVSAEDIMRGSKEKGAPGFGPDIDGWFLPEPVPAIFAAGKQAHVPLLAGWNANEQGGPNAKVSSATFTAQAQQEFGADADGFLAVYKAGTDDEARASAVDYGAHKFIAFSTWRWIEAQLKTGGAPVYRYFFALGSPGDRNHSVGQGAFHSDDIEYVFGALDSRPAAVWRPEDRALSEQMQAYWVNFARTGDPNGASLPPWPVYTAAERKVMFLDATPHAVPDPERERMLFLESVWGRPRDVAPTAKQRPAMP